VGEHHQHLVVDFSDIRCTWPAGASRVKLALLGLDAKIQDMLCRQRVPHPDIFAVFKSLVPMSSSRYAVETELAE
jgi:hypothetical protein